jgi:ADP-heptose:LPS heptosyltransferase
MMVDVPDGFIDLAPDLNDFADTAAAIEQLDLIVSVDTSVAHLAGAMAKPTWILLPKVPEWRWFMEGDASPWYPHVRLFRQAEAGDWNGVVKKVAEALESMAGGT